MSSGPIEVSFSRHPWDFESRHQMATYLERMAAYFMSETGLPASRVELVVEQREGRTTYHYRERKFVDSGDAI